MTEHLDTTQGKEAMPPAPNDTLAQLQAALSKTAGAIEGRRDAFVADPADVETIHRFRTKTRALRSLVAFIKPWQNKGQNAEIQAILKEIVGHTSRLRELDVLEEQVRANPDSSAELVAFCTEEAAAERAAVLEALTSERLTRSFERAMLLSKDVRWKRCYAEQGPSKDVVRARFDALTESVKADLVDLDLADAERTHDIRKRTKRARYVAEQYDDVLGADAKAVAQSMNGHQDDLGEVCDARANMRLIGEFLQRDLPASVVRDLEVLLEQNEVLLRSALDTADARR